LEYIFDWDPKEAALNLRSHSLGFERATTVFLDARAVSIPDDEHSDEEERWVTIGVDASGNVLVVVHTFEEADSERCKIRLISARKATKKEKKQYEIQR
jgi:uncharacterized DUF497 family protein